MKKFNLFTLLILVSISFTSMAQKKSVAKLGLLGLGAKNIRLSYEHVLSPRFTAQLSFATLVRRDMPAMFTEGIAGQDGSGNATGNTDRLDYATFGGWNVMPEFRIYSKKKEGAPAGFYFGPYFKYNNYSIKLGGIDNGNTYDAIGRFTSVGGGINIGCQWVIKDIVTIDWNFLSIGANLGKLTLEYESSQIGVNYEEWANQFNSNQVESPVVGSFNATASSNGIKASTPSAVGLGFRSGLAIGIHF
jgi:hypothetical protein